MLQIKIMMLTLRNLTHGLVGGWAGLCVWELSRFSCVGGFENFSSHVLHHMHASVAKCTSGLWEQLQPSAGACSGQTKCSEQRWWTAFKAGLLLLHWLPLTEVELSGAGGTSVKTFFIVSLQFAAVLKHTQDSNPMFVLLLLTLEKSTLFYLVYGNTPSIIMTQWWGNDSNQSLNVLGKTLSGGSSWWSEAYQK